MGFPSFRDLLNTAWLVFLTSIYTFVGNLTFIPLVMMVGLQVLTEQLAFGLLGLVSFLMIFPVVYYTLIHYFLWGKHDPALPHWFPSWESWKEGLWHYFTGLVLLIGMVVLAVFLVVMGGRELTPQEVEEIGEAIAPVILAIWVFLVSQIFRWRRRGKKKTPNQ